MSDQRPLDSLPPTEPLTLDTGLTLTPRRVKLMLTVHPALPSSATKPIDEWKLKGALTDFLKTSLSVSIASDDLTVRRFKDLKKRKRNDAVAYGSLCIREFPRRGGGGGVVAEDAKVVEEKFREWRERVVGNLDGIELNLEGEKYKLSVSVPRGDDFEELRKDWEEFYAFGSNRGRRGEADTIIIRGVPSRWFSEPKVSSKPSLLVTHTILSAFGKIRNLSVAEDNDFGEGKDEGGVDLIPGLNCKIVVQFEKHKDFRDALKVLCGRSLQKQGSSLKSDYAVSWDKHDFFRNSRIQTQEKSYRTLETTGGHYRTEAPRQYSYDDTRRKRFKE